MVESVHAIAVKTAFGEGQHRDEASLLRLERKLPVGSSCRGNALVSAGPGLKLKVCHFPPGTSKWNKIEHRLFCFITKNWRGRPLTSYEVIVNLISNTTTEKGLIVKAALDETVYETGIKVSDEELAKVLLTRASFHGEWNYTIRPRK